MNWKFWKKEEKVKEKEVPEIQRYGSFLLAKSGNQLNIFSVERERYTEICFFKDPGARDLSCQKYDLSINQHEELIEKLSNEIECIVVNGGYW